MTADDELERVVAWLRREAEGLHETAVRRSRSRTFRYAAELATQAQAMLMAADALTRHEHRETNDG